MSEQWLKFENSDLEGNNIGFEIQDWEEKDFTEQ